MENEELIRQQMENTRASITEKLETLEVKVSDDIQAATGSVADTVKAVQATVSAVQESVEGGAEAVKDAVQDSVATVQHWFDLKSQVQEHPWLVVGGAAGIGFCLGAVLGRSAEPAPKAVATASSGSARAQHNGNGASHAKRRSEKSSFSFLAEFAPQISQLKGLAVTALLGSVRSMVLKSVPAQASGVIQEIIDNVSQKLGGNKVTESDHLESPFTASTQGDEHDERDQFDRPKMGRSMGSTRG